MYTHPTLYTLALQGVSCVNDTIYKHVCDQTYIYMYTRLPLCCVLRLAVQGVGGRAGSGLECLAIVHAAVKEGILAAALGLEPAEKEWAFETMGFLGYRLGLPIILRVL